VKGAGCELLTAEKILFPSALVHSYFCTVCGEECELNCE
jgi:hypothetical protein